MSSGTATPQLIRMRMKIAVIVASINRAEEVGQLLHHLSRQTVPPAQIILSVESAADVPNLDLRVANAMARWQSRITVVTGPRGLPRQRNRGLAAVLDGIDLALFYDDDFLPTPTALAGIARLFALHPEIAGATGLVLRDGVGCGGLDYKTACAALDSHASPTQPMIEDCDELYGCNMVVRCKAVADLRFDENLPLYAWQEDVDFAGQLLKKGRVVRSNAFAGVHRGVIKSRSPGLMLGYSQMVNPSYLVKKGTMRPRKAVTLMVKNFLANHGKALFPEAHIDRIGRARGNWLGIWHILRGQADPARALQLK